MLSLNFFEMMKDESQFLLCLDIVNGVFFLRNGAYRLEDLVFQGTRAIFLNAIYRPNISVMLEIRYFDIY